MGFAVSRYRVCQTDENHAPLDHRKSALISQYFGLMASHYNATLKRAGVKRHTSIGDRLWDECVDRLVCAARRWKPDGEATFKTYLIKHLRYAFRDAVKGYRHSIRFDGIDGIEIPTNPKSYIEEWLDYANEADRDLLRMVFAEGISRTEAGSRLSVSGQTIKNWLRRITAGMRIRIGAADGPDSRSRVNDNGLNPDLGYGTLPGSPGYLVGSDRTLWSCWHGGKMKACYRRISGRESRPGEFRIHSNGKRTSMTIGQAMTLAFPRIETANASVNRQS